jgi:hypothetical protein
MNDIRDFLSWFEGFQENIKQRPTAEQWAKVVDRISKIQAPVAVTTGAKGVIPLTTTNSEPQPRPVMSRGAAMSAGP